MKLAYYKKIIEKYRLLKKRNCLDDLANLFPDVPRSTLESIIFQDCQRKTKKTYYFHCAAHNLKKYYDRLMEQCVANWSECGALLKIADEVDLSPALMSKFILEYHYKEKEKEHPEVQKPKVKVNEMLKNPSIIDDPYLAAEVKMCILIDENYGPVSDIIRNSVGQKYEKKLKDELIKLGITFIDEKQLRERGYDKTPDVKLDIPIAFESHVINWIESKASFGDEDRHREYLRDQYWSYCNRFGPGLVIYWAGYIDELNINKEHGIMISDSLPVEMIKMDPTVLKKKSSLY